MLTTSSQAPDFTLPSTNHAEDSDVSTFRLSEELENGPVLLNFYLFDFHPACMANMCTLHDLSWFDLDPTLTVAGISTDNVFSHRAFAAKDRLAFSLLADSDGSVAESFGVLYDEFQGHNRIAQRSVFLIDPTGTIRYRWAGEAADVQPEWTEVKHAVEAISTHGLA